MFDVMILDGEEFQMYPIWEQEDPNVVYLSDAYVENNGNKIGCFTKARLLVKIIEGKTIDISYYQRKPITI